MFLHIQKACIQYINVTDIFKNAYLQRKSCTYKIKYLKHTYYATFILYHTFLIT